MKLSPFKICPLFIALFSLIALATGPGRVLVPSGYQVSKAVS